jgi:hypothetical protein
MHEPRRTALFYQRYALLSSKPQQQFREINLRFLHCPAIEMSALLGWMPD